MSRWIRLLAGLAWASLLGMAIAQDRPPIVAAASDLKFAVTEIAARFEIDTGRKVNLNFGSSGNFVRQIQQGAPFELFMSADEDFVFKLADAGLTRDRGAPYAVGRIVLYVPKGSKLKLDPALKGLRSGWSEVHKLAIANPEHAPYGRAAEQALHSLALWEFAQPKLILGENIAQTAQYVVSGGAEAGIIALSLALAPELARQGEHVLLPDHLHQPLRQRMVLTRGAGETATAFYKYLQEPTARGILRKYGFVLPGE
ncbi:MAG TPA: molybdate ABC transporter substrate-binding protein [Burkholderiaceae bacterium]|nr:molybdate ABC transporter substrate-binding protein [Burkholderiaceae bacterium]HQR68969.1 molybdate ABC transporter substrate-binding protein [Burkholderiaceae bacterium]